MTLCWREEMDTVSGWFVVRLWWWWTSLSWTFWKTEDKRFFDRLQSRAKYYLCYLLITTIKAHVALNGPGSAVVNSFCICFCMFSCFCIITLSRFGSLDLINMWFKPHSCVKEAYQTEMFKNRSCSSPPRKPVMYSFPQQLGCFVLANEIM